MSFDVSLKATDLAIVFATLLGPVLAIQIQKFIEKRGQIKQRQLHIFRTLMATRAMVLSPAHVEALNAIPVEFYGPNNKALKKVNSAWQEYFDSLNVQGPATETLVQRRIDLLTELLYVISQSVGYDFSKSDIAKVYYPQIHHEIESDQTIVRQGLSKLFRGEIAIPVQIGLGATTKTSVSRTTSKTKAVKQ